MRANQAHIPQTGENGTFHTNPKRKRGLVLPPRLRFGLVSASTACGIRGYQKGNDLLSKCHEKP